MEAIEQSLRDNAEESEKRAATSETLVDTLSSLKDEMSEKFGAVTSKVDNLNEILKHSENGGTEKFNKVEANFNALQTALRDIQTDNSRKIERVVEDTRNSKDLLTWLESKIKESKVEYTGKVRPQLSPVQHFLRQICPDTRDCARHQRTEEGVQVKVPRGGDGHLQDEGETGDDEPDDRRDPGETLRV